MARTNLQVITDSLRLAGVIHQIETPSNEDAQDALRRLNDMMLALDRHNGIKLGYYPQSSLSANIPIDDEYLEGITALLAEQIGLHWGASLSPEVARQVSMSRRALQAEFNVPKPAKLDHVPGSRRSTYNIDSDNF